MDFSVKQMTATYDSVQKGDKSLWHDEGEAFENPLQI